MPTRVLLGIGGARRPGRPAHRLPRVGLDELPSRGPAAPHGFVPGAAEFAPFLAIYDALVARFGADADARFAAVLNNITRARRQSKRQQYNAARRARPRTAEAEAQRRARSAYNATYRARPRTDEELAAERLARAAYMRRYRARPRTPAQQAAERAGKAAYMKRYRNAAKTEAAV